MEARAGTAASRLVLSESRNLRFAVMTVFYFAQGLPMGLFLTAVAAWLADNGGSPAEVAAIVSFVYLPWSFKFIGAALMDRYTFLPMGRRRIWLIGSQFVMVAGLALAAFIAPTPDQATLIGWIGFLILSGGAMQDVAIDGMAVDILPQKEQGTASGFMFGGQALGLAAGAAGGGYLLAAHGSAIAFLAFIPVTAAILLLAVAIRERPGERRAPWSAGEASPVTAASHDTDWLRIFTITFRSILKRDSLLYVVSGAALRTVAGAFIAFWPVFATTRAGYDTAGYSAMYATVGLVASLACMFIGGALNVKLGPRLSSMITYLGYVLIGIVYLISPAVAIVGFGFVVFTLCWNMTETLTTISTNPLRMRLSDKRVAATQFTIYNSLGNLPVPLGAAIYAWAAGAGGIPVLMPILIALMLFGIATMALVRIGKPVDDEDELPPKVD